MTDTSAPQPKRSGRWLLLIPLVLFTGLAGLFLVQLNSGPPSRLPSVLIGREVPQFDLPPIQGASWPGFATGDLRRGRVTVVNVWASWCVPCRDEHPILMQMARDGSYDLVGINNKDNADNARRFLGQLGNPFSRIGADTNGRVSIDWGVYGVPETFVVDGQGRIAFKHVGPIDQRILETRLMPEIRKAMAAR